MAETTFRLAIPEAGLSIEQNTEHVPHDNKYYVLRDGAVVAGYQALKKAREKLQQLKDEVGFKPAAAAPTPEGTGDELANREHIERLLDAASSYWSQSHKHRGGGGRGGRGGV